ncbi:hypothetical protein [Salinifilum ghardaiensis]
MTDPDATTPTSDETGAAPESPQDPANLQSAEDLDTDELGGDPVEEGVDPPEDWTVVTAHRPTTRSDREGESLDEELAEERPDAPAGAEAEMSGSPEELAPEDYAERVGRSAADDPDAEAEPDQLPGGGTGSDWP